MDGPSYRKLIFTASERKHSARQNHASGLCAPQSYLRFESHNLFSWGSFKIFFFRFEEVLYVYSLDQEGLLYYTWLHVLVWLWKLYICSGLALNPLLVPRIFILK